MIVTLQMECSICYSDITSATGKVELSCLHPFHFSCLTQWFNKQKSQGSHENCPLCRHESNDFEKMPLPAPVEQEDEAGEGDVWEEEPSLHQVLAQEHTRERFKLLKTTKTPEELQLYAAGLIKACWLGYQDRLLYYDRMYNRDVIIRHKEYITNVQNRLNADLNKAKFLKATLGLSRYQVKLMAARKIQLVWRSLRKPKLAARKVMICGTWREIRSGVWERMVMNPEDDAPIIFVGPNPPLCT